MAVITLTNLRLWDGTSDGYGAADTIRVDRGIITAVGARADVGEEGQFDCRGMTALPGLIDAHVHLCLDPEQRDPFAQSTDPEQVLGAIRTRVASMRAAGITTARDWGGGQWLDLKIRDAIASGEMAGPRLLCSGQPITSPQGHCHFWGGEAPDLAAALEVLNRQVSHGVDLIKVMATGGNLTPGSVPSNAQFDAATLTAIVDAARRHGLHVAAHCHGTVGIHNAAIAKVTTVEHCSWVGANGWQADYDADAAALLGQHGVWVSPTMNSGWQRNLSRPDYVARVQQNYRQLKANGVRLIASTDAGIPNVFHNDLPKALPFFSQFAELTPVQTLRAATSDCATAIGVGARVGRLSAGYAADLLLVEGDPLQDLAVLQGVKRVMHGGRWFEHSPLK